MSDFNKTLRTSSTNKLTKRPSTPKSNNTPISLQKREKLKSLLIEKFIKKFNANDSLDIIEREVSNFISKDKLTEVDLKNFENKLNKLINESKNIKEIKENFDKSESIKYTPSEKLNEDSFNSSNQSQKYPLKINDFSSNNKNDNKNKKNSFLKSNTKNISLNSNQNETNHNSKIPNTSRPSSVRNLNSKNMKMEKNKIFNNDEENLDLESIKNFEIKKLFLDEKRPLDRNYFNIESDEWNVIDKYKRDLYFNRMNETKKNNMEVKLKNRLAFDSQLKEKELLTYKNKEIEINHHENVISNIQRLSIEESRKIKEIQEKKLKEKEYRDLQMRENTQRKKQTYLETMNNDREICKYLNSLIFI